MRAAKNDFLQGFRYHVKANQGGSSDPLQGSLSSEPVNRGTDMTDGSTDAGFQSVTMPELSVEQSEYREGTFKATQKYPGVPTVSDVSLMRGVIKTDTAFHDMVLASVQGDEYRMDVMIIVYQRTEMGAANDGTYPDGARRVKCKNAFAIRAKANGDLDSMTSDVSVAEVDLSIEWFEIAYK